VSEFRDAKLQLVALVSVAAALGAMAVDHLLGTEGEETGLEFILGLGTIAYAAAALT
jgi:hypothetical protein